MEREIEVRCVGCQGPLAIRVPPGASEASCPGCRRAYAVKDGILILGAAANPADYPTEGYDLLASVEPRHFWFAGRNRMILSVLRKALGSLEGLLALELGCGTGFVLSALERAGMKVAGVDMHVEGLLYARKRVSGGLAQSEGPEIAFANRFDAVLLCDVIEHITDDVSALRQASLALRDGGALLVTVPADASLWSPVDAASGHKRRYSKESLVRAMESAGLRVSDARYFNVLLWPVLKLKRSRMQDLPADFSSLQESLKVPPRWLNALLAAAMATDAVLSRVPFLRGGSLVAVGRRE